MWPFPKQRDFFKMLSDQTAKVEEGLKLLADFLIDPTIQNAEKVKDCEEEADELRRFLVNELNKAFVTPFDREDIYALSRSIDDVLDYARSTMEEMTLFEIVPDSHISKMVSILGGAAKDLNFAVHNLKNSPHASLDHLMRVKKDENSVEICYREGLVELFKTQDVIKILKTREVYRHLSNAADRAAYSADILSDILVKIS